MCADDLEKYPLAPIPPPRHVITIDFLSGVQKLAPLARRGFQISQKLAPLKSASDRWVINRVKMTPSAVHL